MKKLLTGLLLALVSCSSVFAKTHSDKTFLMPRSHNDNLAMEYTGWHEQISSISHKKWGGAFQATGFYQESDNEKDLGKYFGKCNNATGPDATNPYAGTIQDFIWVTYRSSSSGSQKSLLLVPRHIIRDKNKHDSGTIGKGLDVKGIFRPKQTSYGIRFDYHQRLDALTKGLYLKVAVPVVNVKNNMDVCYTGSRLTQKLPTTENMVSLANYLAGRIENNELPNIQQKLCSAKICGSQSTTGVADVDIKLGYNFLDKKHKHLGVNLCVIVPTNGAPSGEWLFEPVLGLAGHWALGVGIDSKFELWGNKNKSLGLVCALNYKYVLDETEKRTLGFKYGDSIVGIDAAAAALVAGKRVSMGHYMLGGQQGTTGLFPLANVLTREVGISPGSQFEALVNIAFTCKQFTFDVGYNLFAKEEESADIKCWPNDTYAVANFDYLMLTPFDITNIDHVWDGVFKTSGTPRPIQCEDLCTDTVSTPNCVTHKILAGLSYACNKCKYRPMLGIGGSWEFLPGSNDGLDGYALWAKAGIAF